jgi:molecular chaperone GrpE
MPKQKKTTEEVRTNLEEIIAERDANLAGWKRSLADFENYQKQFEKEKETLVHYLKADAVSKLLPIMANWETAMKNIPAELEGNEWIKGVTAIKSQLDEFFKKEGLEKVATVGEKFDPNLHEAMLEEETEGPEGIILEEFEPGYKISERVIKYPKVKVSKKRN